MTSNCHCVSNPRSIRLPRSHRELHLGRRMLGLTYVEVTVATLLIAIAVIPAIEALHAGLGGAQIQKEAVQDHQRMLGKLESVLAEPFNELDKSAADAGNRTTPSAYSEVLTHPDGRQITCNVYLSRYDRDNADADGDPFTGVDPDLLWVRVALAGTLHELETLVNR